MLEGGVVSIFSVEKDLERFRDDMTEGVSLNPPATAIE